MQCISIIENQHEDDLNEGGIVVTKDISMEEKWDGFFENGDTYDDYEVMELDEEMGREVW